MRSFTFCLLALGAATQAASTTTTTKSNVKPSTTTIKTTSTTSSKTSTKTSSSAAASPTGYQGLQLTALAGLLDLYQTNYKNVQTVPCSSRRKRTIESHRGRRVPHSVRSTEQLEKLLASPEDSFLRTAQDGSFEVVKRGVAQVDSPTKRQGSSCISCSTTNGLAECLLGIFIGDEQMELSYWTAKNGSLPFGDFDGRKADYGNVATGFNQGSTPLSQSLVTYRPYILAAFPGNATASTEYDGVSTIWQNLVAHENDANFYTA